MNRGEKRPTHPPSPKLTTLGGIVAELGRVYREARQGELPLADATRLASILSLMRSAIEGSDLERRVGVLEKASDNGRRR
jgi:hypothetical protein